MRAKQYRPDKEGPHRRAFELNKKKILATATICGICGKPVDKNLRWPHPLSPCIDHIIPVIRDGHPSDIDNLQLAHVMCNRMKADHLLKKNSRFEEDMVISNRDLPQSCDWAAYRPKED